MIGPLKSGKLVRDGAEATLKRWLPATLAELRTAYGLAIDKLPTPRDHHFHRLARTDLLFAADQTPAVLIATPSKTVRRREGGIYDATFTLAVEVIARGGGLSDNSFTDTVDTTDLYALAVETVLVQHPKLGGVAAGCWLASATYNPLGDADRTLMRSALTFNVKVPSMLDATAGPPDTWDEAVAWPFPVEPTDVQVVVERMEG